MHGTKPKILLSLFFTQKACRPLNTLYVFVLKNYNNLVE